MQLQQSLAFRCCLRLTLRVGNMLNRGTPRSNAKGFEVHVLPSLSAIKSSRDTQVARHTHTPSADSNTVPTCFKYVRKRGLNLCLGPTVAHMNRCSK